MVASCSRAVGPEADPGEAASFVESEPSKQPPESRLSGLVVGESGGCVYVDRKQLWCWGAELRDGSADLPPHEVALRADGPLKLDRRKECAVDGGKLVCESEWRPEWGAVSDFVDFDGDRSDMCAVAKDGEIRCWNYEDLVRREVIEGAIDVEQYAFGVCVRTEAGRIACPAGVLPTDSARNNDPLQLVPGVEDISKLEFGRQHGCMLNRAGRVRCFGSNVWAQLGVGDSQHHEHPVDVSLPGAASELAVSNNQSCAIVADRVLCWGAHDLDSQTQVDPYAPNYGRVNGRPHFGQYEFDFEATALHVQAGSSCATKPDGSLWCWGYPGPGVGPRGHGGAARAAAPEQLPSPWPITEFHPDGIRSGDEFILAASSWPWQLHDERWRIRGVAGFASDGDGLICVFGGVAGFRCIEAGEIVEPATWVPKLRNVSDLTMFPLSMCAVHGGRVSCLSEPPRWVQIAGLSNIRSVVGDGKDRVCALANDGRISCWRGAPDDPDGSYSVSEDPYVLGEREVVEIAWGWGLLARTRSGALRTGPAVEADEQLETLIDAGVLEVAGAPGTRRHPGHACARVDRDGDGSSERIACFGDDRLGQLGRLGEHVRLWPTEVQWSPMFMQDRPDR
jgi:hypothetical protein